MSATLTPRLLAGRCASGAELGKGSRFHLTTEDAYGIGKALCGVKPGRRSAGWSNATADEPTCPRCVRRAAAMAVTV